LAGLGSPADQNPDWPNRCPNSRTLRRSALVPAVPSPNVREVTEVLDGDRIQASAARFLIDGGEEDAASVLLACRLEGLDFR
jgi:hypothetical protein